MPFRLGITGERGFIGSHLAASARADGRFSVTPFRREWFDRPKALAEFAQSCDAVVHLAGISRSDRPREAYDVNLELTAKLAAARPRRVLFGSTTHIDKDSWYHASKRDGAKLLMGNSAFPTVELLMPNTFGPGGKIFYNSAVMTFAWLAAHGEKPERIDPVPLKLIPVDELCAEILRIALSGGPTRREIIAHTVELTLPELWSRLSALAAGNAPVDELDRRLAAVLHGNFTRTTTP